MVVRTLPGFVFREFTSHIVEFGAALQFGERLFFLRVFLTLWQW